MEPIDNGDHLDPFDRGEATLVEMPRYWLSSKESQVWLRKFWCVSLCLYVCVCAHACVCIVGRAAVASEVGGCNS